MELWDVYDADRRRTGRVIERGNGFGQEAYHLIVHVCIFNAAGEMLIQRRAPDKAYLPGLWDVSAGGSAVAGEDSWQAAEREVREELGLTVPLRGVRPHFSVNYANGFDDFYAVLAEPKPEEIRRMLADGRFMPYFSGVLELIFQVRDNYDGAIRSKARRDPPRPEDIQPQV